MPRDVWGAWREACPARLKSERERAEARWIQGNRMSPKPKGRASGYLLSELRACVFRGSADAAWSARQNGVSDKLRIGDRSLPATAAKDYSLKRMTAKWAIE